MAQWSEVWTADLEKLIISSEYYSPENLDFVSVLKRSKFSLSNLNRYCSIISDGDHSKTQYEESGIRYLLSECISEMDLNLDLGRFISRKLHEQLRRSQLQPGDVVLTKTGVYFGKATVIPPDLAESNTSAHVARLVPGVGRSSAWLALFLNCKYGQFQLRRRGNKGSRPEMKLVEMQDILIPEPDDKNKIWAEQRNSEIRASFMTAKKSYYEAAVVADNELHLPKAFPAYSREYGVVLQDMFTHARWDIPASNASCSCVIPFC